MSKEGTTPLPWELLNLVTPDEHFRNLINIADTVESTCHKHYGKSQQLTFCPVPQIVGITGACENVDTLFKVGNQQAIPLFFSQTGQLMLEAVLQYMPGFYTIIHSGRDERKEDPRHLLEFLLAEEEFGWPLVAGDTPYDEKEMFAILLRRIETATKAIVKRVVCKHGQILQERYGLNPEEMLKNLTRDYHQISYDDAITLLQQHGYPQINWGNDLKPEHEAQIVAVLNGVADGKNYHALRLAMPVLVKRYPKDIKFFNMKVTDDDPRVVWSADLLLPFAGEAVGSAVREHDGDKLKERLLTSNMFRLHQENGGKYQDFVWYVEKLVGAKKTPPHAGYGLGVSRLLQWVLGIKDIRLCSLFSLMSELTGDFSEERRGMGPMFQKQKTILLSIADEAKENLLPQIAGHLNGDLVLYATKGTHNFLQQLGVPTSLVYKVDRSEKPNLAELMQRRVFDIVINIPSSQTPTAETTDGDKIRWLAIDNGVYLITDPEAAKYLLAKLAAQPKS